MSWSNTSTLLGQLSCQKTKSHGFDQIISDKSESALLTLFLPLVSCLITYSNFVLGSKDEQAPNM